MANQSTDTPVSSRSSKNAPAVAPSQLFFSQVANCAKEKRFREIPTPSNFVAQYAREEQRSPPQPVVEDPSRHWIHVPENGRYFVGRQGILEKIKISFVQVATGQRSFALWAGKGFGKTQIARKIVSENTHHSPYILWCQAENKTRIMETFEQYAISRKLVDNRGGDSPDKNFETAARGFLDWFRTLHYWPYGRSGSVLITTHDSSFGRSNLAGDGARLNMLETPDAIKMVLFQLSPESRNTHANAANLDEEEARKLVSPLQNFPLAIHACLGAINEAEGGVTIAESFQDLCSSSGARKAILGVEKDYGK
ncbi:hypothetical protein QBC38DRAFT_522044 [Podospora fimiseda]|uniref:ATP-binding protein n=1 Tax=Podospora fimiseda TaxID=252190 RepID=A0AAN6YS80_9PEZI|nr:hypothetical protein QBC38DRAFT_522044 [Podospora fimiseda]